MKFELPELPYEKDDLEPYISKKTLEFHHGKFHQEYIINLNSQGPIEDVIKLQKSLISHLK